MTQDTLAFDAARDGVDNMDAPVHGRYFDGQTSRAHQVALTVRGDMAHLHGDIERSCPLARLRVSERSRHAVRKITFPDEAVLETRDLAGLAQLLQRSGHADSWVVRVQQSWRGALLAASGTVLTLALAYVYALPVLADQLARRMPPSMEQKLGRGVLVVMDKRMLSPSRFSDQRMAALAQAFYRLRPPQDAAPEWRLLFRQSHVGPNAFALPSGDIVLTDEIVKLLKDDEAVMGVLAHELGHLHAHHITRRVIQGSVVAAGSAMLFGDVSSLLPMVPTALLDSKYSRDAEREADDYAVAMLKYNGIGVEHYAQAFEHLQQWMNEHGVTGGSTYLSSHPANAERIARIRAAAATP